MKKIWLQLFVIVLAFTNGCASTKSPTGEPEIGREQAIELAKREALRRGWKDFEVRRAELESGWWRVWLEAVPSVPGGHATVEISKDGKQVRYLPGY